MSCLSASQIIALTIGGKTVIVFTQDRVLEVFNDEGVWKTFDDF